MDPRRIAGARKLKGRLLTNIFFVACILLAVCLVTTCGCGVKHESEKGNEQVNKPEQADSPTSNKTSSLSKSEQALERAKADGKPALLCFHSLKCAPCIQIEENLNQVMPEFQGKVEFVVVDVYDPAEYNLCMEYNIETIPTTIFLKKDGKIMSGFLGVLTPDQLRKQLNALLSS